MNSPASPRYDDERLARAAEWLFKLRDPEVSQADIAEWFVWCDQEPDNQLAFEQVQSTWRAAALIEAVPVAPQDLEADDYRGQVTVSEWSRARSGSSPARRRRIALPAALLGMRARIAVAAVSVGVALMLLLGWLRHLDQARDITVATVIGVNREMQLPDGSSVTLAAGSRLATRFTREARNVFLERGEALFKVQKDPARPFVVHAQAMTVTAVGTAFNVKSEAGIVRVTVTEGVVDVGEEPPFFGGLRNLLAATAVSGKFRLAAGNQVTLVPGTPKPVALAAAGPQATTWVGGTLTFVDEPLGSVVAAVNRYARVPVVLADGELGAYHYTGTVMTSRIDDWLRGLTRVFPVEVVRDNTPEVVIRPRP